MPLSRRSTSIAWHEIQTEPLTRFDQQKGLWTMLVLTRKRAESIKIGNDIVIKVIQTSRGTVKLGIEAPAHVRVLRAELDEFAPLSSAAVAVPVVADDDAAETDEDPDASVDGERYIDFDTEYAVELDDQMMCVATD